MPKKSPEIADEGFGGTSVVTNVLPE